jgi:hypothetical protein
MSCKHEFLSDFDDAECVWCGSSRVETLKEALAAAEARIAELEKEKSWFITNGQELIRLHQQKPNKPKRN